MSKGVAKPTERITASSVRHFSVLHFMFFFWFYGLQNYFFFSRNSATQRCTTSSLEHLAAKEPNISLSGRHFPVCGGEQNRALKEEWKLDLHVSSKTQMNSDVALCLLCK